MDIMLVNLIKFPWEKVEEKCFLSKSMMQQGITLQNNMTNSQEEIDMEIKMNFHFNIKQFVSKKKINNNNTTRINILILFF